MLVSSHRLRDRRDFSRIYRTGRRFSTPFFQVVWQQNNTKTSRFGISVSNKVLSRATDRNKEKRRLRHAIIEMLPRMPQGYDVIFVLRSEVQKATFREIHDILEIWIVKQQQNRQSK